MPSSTSACVRGAYTHPCGLPDTDVLQSALLSCVMVAALVLCVWQRRRRRPSHASSDTRYAVATPPVVPATALPTATSSPPPPDAILEPVETVTHWATSPAVIPSPPTGNPSPKGTSTLKKGGTSPDSARAGTRKAPSPVASAPKSPAPRLINVASLGKADSAWAATHVVPGHVVGKVKSPGPSPSPAAASQRSQQGSTAAPTQPSPPPTASALKSRVAADERASDGRAAAQREAVSALAAPRRAVEAGSKRNFEVIAAATAMIEHPTQRLIRPPPRTIGGASTAAGSATASARRIRNASVSPSRSGPLGNGAPRGAAASTVQLRTSPAASAGGHSPSPSPPLQRTASARSLGGPALSVDTARHSYLAVTPATARGVTVPTPKARVPATMTQRIASAASLTSTAATASPTGVVGWPTGAPRSHGYVIGGGGDKGGGSLFLVPALPHASPVRGRPEEATFRSPVPLPELPEADNEGGSTAPSSSSAAGSAPPPAPAESDVGRTHIEPNAAETAGQGGQIGGGGTHPQPGPGRLGRLFAGLQRADSSSAVREPAPLWPPSLGLSRGAAGMTRGGTAFSL